MHCESPSSNNTAPTSDFDARTALQVCIFIIMRTPFCAFFDCPDCRLENNNRLFIRPLPFGSARRAAHARSGRGRVDSSIARDVYIFFFFYSRIRCTTRARIFYTRNAYYLLCALRIVIYNNIYEIANSTERTRNRETG